MKNGALFFLGVFGAIALSWGGVVLASSHQISKIQPYYDTLESQFYPYKQAGIAAEGEQVYKSMGCAACHTQEVRRPGLGYDDLRGWGKRQSVARDYIYESTPPLGELRRGPDLTNFGPRAVKLGLDETHLLTQLYLGSAGMPPYRFLFERQKVIGEPLSSALPINAGPGYQIIPSYHAKALVAYLLSLKQDYVYPEAQPLEPAKEGTN